MEQGTTTAAARRRPPALARGGVAAASVWETRMKMDEVKGGIKVFNAAAGAGCEDADDEEGIRIYRRLRRNQSDGGGGAAAAAKKRRNWKASDPVTAIGELRKSRSEAAAVGVRRARVGTLEKKAVGGEIKEVVVVGEREKASMEVEGGKEMNKPLEGAKNLEEETEEEDDEEEVEEEALVKEVDQDHMAIDEDSVKSPSPAQGIKTVPARAADERVANLEPVKTPPENKLAAAIDLRSMNPEPMTPPQVEKKPTPVIIHHMTNAEPARPSPEKKPSPVISCRIPKQEPVKTSPVEEHEEVQGSPSPYSRSNGRMQNIVDLVMWRDVSKSALVFGFGTFLLISSSYAKDLNFNPITASSYLGLIYLGLRFLYKSILNRGACVDYDEREDNYLVGEDEAIWLLRLVLPYINEVLLNLRSLFSGEPATTMKLALLLFAMARCGNFVTLWTLAKLVFFGVFIIPKVCSSYSTQLARYGKFWLERFRDAWESCSHKKAVVAAVFTLVWNVSSTVARVWAVFMLVVAMKCYQQRKLEGWSSTAEEGTQVEDDEAQEEYLRKPGAVNTQAEAQSFGVLPRHRRGLQVSGEIGRERLRVKGGIQPR